MIIVEWIIFGLAVGIIGKLLMPGRDPGGFVITVLLGIAGALVGGLLALALILGGFGAKRVAGKRLPMIGGREQDELAEELELAVAAGLVNYLVFTYWLRVPFPVSVLGF